MLACQARGVDRYFNGLLMMGALNLVECVAFVGVDKPRR
jgi:hypothetical protein